MGFIKENKWAIWLIIVSLLVIAGVAFFIFRQPATTAKPNISLSIDAPQQTPSGHQVIYQVHFANNDKDQINNVVLDMLYPQGFTFTESSPQATKLSGTQFQIPTLSPGQSSLISIKGNLAGNSGEQKTISAVMHYRFSNSSADFVAQAQSQSQITNSNIVLQFDGEGQTNNDQTLTYTLTYTNTASSDLNGITLKLNVPQQFTVDSLTPKPDSSSLTQWALGSLHPGQSGTVKIVGRFVGSNVGAQQTFSAEADGHDDNGQPIVFSNATYQVAISNFALQADITGSDQQSSGLGNNVVLPGDSIQYQVHYRNNSSVPQQGVTVAVVLTGEAADLATLQASNGSISNNVIIWSAAQVSDFNSLNPNAEGDLTFSVRVKNPATRANDSNLTISAHTEIKSAAITQPFLGPEFAMKVQTVPTVENQVSYAAGPTPMRVGFSTSYQIVLSVRNSTNDLTGTTITMSLPNSLGFDKTSINSAEQPNVTYDSNTRKLSWNIGTLAAHTGDFKALKRLVFTVTVTPSPSDVSKAITLVNHIQLSGSDSFTANQITKTSDDLSTLSVGSGGIVSP